jgi:hypothetical protein
MLNRFDLCRTWGPVPGHCSFISAANVRGAKSKTASSYYQTTLTRWLLAALPGVLMQKSDKPRRSHNCPQLCELVLCGRAQV